MASSANELEEHAGRLDALDLDVEPATADLYHRRISQPQKRTAPDSARLTT